MRGGGGGGRKRKMLHASTKKKTALNPIKFEQWPTFLISLLEEVRKCVPENLAIFYHADKQVQRHWNQAMWFPVPKARSKANILLMKGRAAVGCTHDVCLRSLVCAN